MSDRIQDIAAIDSSRDRLNALAEDAQKLKTAAEEADPSFGTWGPFLGALIGVPYSTLISGQVTSLMEDVPAALEGHGTRLDSCARAYEETDEGIAAQLEIVQSSLDELSSTVDQAQIN